MPSPPQRGSPFPCDYPGCTTTFSRTRDLKRHQLNFHNRKMTYCNQPGCLHLGAMRKYILQEHIAKYHPELLPGKVALSLSSSRGLNHSAVVLEIPEDPSWPSWPVARLLHMHRMPVVTEHLGKSGPRVLDSTFRV